jgi:hypothetical protein
MMPWLKRSGPRKVTKTLTVWGREGLLTVLLIPAAEADMSYSVPSSFDSMPSCILDGAYMEYGAKVLNHGLCSSSMLLIIANRTYDEEKRSSSPLTYFAMKFVKNF